MAIWPATCARPAHLGRKCPQCSGRRQAAGRRLPGRGSACVLGYLQCQAAGGSPSADQDRVEKAALGPEFPQLFFGPGPVSCRRRRRSRAACRQGCRAIRSSVRQGRLTSTAWCPSRSRAAPRARAAPGEAEKKREAEAEAGNCIRSTDGSGHPSGVQARWLGRRQNSLPPRSEGPAPVAKGFRLRPKSSAAVKGPGVAKPKNSSRPQAGSAAD